MHYMSGTNLEQNSVSYLGQYIAKHNGEIWRSYAGYLSYYLTSRPSSMTIDGLHWDTTHGLHWDSLRGQAYPQGIGKMLEAEG